MIMLHVKVNLIDLQQCNGSNIPDETSALESYYLMARNPAGDGDTLINTPRTLWSDNSTFHMSQVYTHSFDTLVQAQCKYTINVLAILKDNSLHDGLTIYRLGIK